MQADDLNELRTMGIFDIGLTEQYDACGFAVFQALGIPRVIWLSATAAFRPQPEALGASYPLSYVPGRMPRLGLCFNRRNCRTLLTLQ